MLNVVWVCQPVAGRPTQHLIARCRRHREHLKSCGSTSKDELRLQPVGRKRSSSLLVDTLCLLKGACHLAEGETIAIVDRRGLIRLQALAVEARGVCAVQVGERIAAADVFESCVNTRNRI